MKQFGENTLNSKGLNLKLNESNLLKVKNEEDKEIVDSPFRQMGVFGSAKKNHSVNFTLPST